MIASSSIFLALQSVQITRDKYHKMTASTKFLDHKYSTSSMDPSVWCTTSMSVWPAHKSYSCYPRNSIRRCPANYAIQKHAQRTMLSRMSCGISGLDAIGNTSVSVTKCSLQAETRA